MGIKRTDGPAASGKISGSGSSLGSGSGSGYTTLLGSGTLETSDFVYLDNPPRQANIAIYGEDGCIAHDTRLCFQVRDRHGRIQNSKGGTIELLFERFHRRYLKSRRGAYQRPQTIDSEFFISSIRDDGGVVGNRILNVLDTGRKEVYLLTTESGRSIKTTLDHEFMTPNGYLPLSSLAPGLDVLITPDKPPKTGRKKRIQRPEFTVKYHPSGRTKLVAEKYLYYRVLRSHAVLEAYHNGMDLESYIKFLNTESRDRIAGEIWVVPRGSEVHHLDENPLNDDPSNLVLVVDSSEHQKRFHVDSTRERFTNFVEPETVAGIDFVGTEQVFDLVVADPYRNFLANKFAVHNCGKTDFCVMRAPCPIVVLNFDGRADDIVREARVEYGRDVRMGRFMVTHKNLDPDAMQVEAEKVRERIFRNFEIAIDEAVRGRVRTILFDTATELDDIFKLSLDGTLKMTRVSSHGKGQDFANRHWWRIFNLAREAKAAHVIVTARMGEIWVDDKPTGKFKPKCSKAVNAAVDWSAQIRLRSKFGQAKPSRELYVTKAGTNGDEIFATYTEDQWSKPPFESPFVYGCVMNYRDSLPEDWK